MKLLTTTIAVLMLLPLEAQAQPATYSFHPAMKVIPPLELDYPYAGTLIVYRADRKQLAINCPRSFMPLTLGCNFRYAKENRCEVYIADDAVLAEQGWAGTYDIIFRHEIGHCNDINGVWRNHIGSRTVDAPRGKAPSAVAPSQRWRDLELSRRTELREIDLWALRAGETLSATKGP